MSALVTISAMLPIVLAALAVVDVVRTRQPLWWILIVVAAPVVGPIAYFAITRLGGAAGPRDSRGTPRQQRRLAERRLADLELQLGNWRGPALLAESADELMTLRRFAEAEARWREARERGATVADANLGWAESLVALGRVEEAIPLLEALAAVDSDHAMGRAQLLLARCLEQLGRNAEAEAALREILQHRNTPEARVRLARLLALRGEDVVGRAMAADAVSDVASLGPALRRRNAAWARLGRRVARGDLAPFKTPLLEPEAPGAGPRWPWVLALGVALLLLALGLMLSPCLVGGLMLREHAETWERTRAEASRELAELDRRAGSRLLGDPALLVLEPRDVDDYLRVRARAAAAVRAEEAVEMTEMREPLAAGSALVAACAEADLTPEAFASLVAVIEGRFLGVPEARLLELPASVRGAAAALAWRRRVGTPADAAAAGAELARLAALAPAPPALAPATAALLESRRAELEAALHRDDVPRLLRASEEARELREGAGDLEGR